MRWLLGVFLGWILTVQPGCAVPENQAYVKAQVETDTTLILGKMLFDTRCAGCHTIHQPLTGPALKNVAQRWPSHDTLVAFIKNSEAIIAVHPYARQLWIQYNQTPMAKNEDLSQFQIESILQFIKQQSEQNAP